MTGGVTEVEFVLPVVRQQREWPLGDVSLSSDPTHQSIHHCGQRLRELFGSTLNPTSSQSQTEGGD